MLERRRKNKHYDIVPGDEVDGAEEDVELGIVRGEQETGRVGGGEGEEGQAAGRARAGKTDVTEELDNWDENAEDWDEEPAAGTSGDSLKSPVPGGEDEPKKRID